MRAYGAKPVLFLLGGALVLGLVGLTWALGLGVSEAQQDTMHNCPQPGKWAISVWGGDDDTDTGEALAACGAGAVDAAYYIDPTTNNWQSYFLALPQASTLPALDNMQGIITHGAVGAPAATATPTLTPTPTPTPAPTPTPTEEAGYLPPPEEVGHVSAGGNAVVTIQNGTPYGLTVDYEGPTTGTVSLPVCGDCTEWYITPMYADPCEDVPEETVTIPAGTYSVTARVDEPSISPFVGEWILQGDTEYSSCLYIRTYWS